MMNDESIVYGYIRNASALTADARFMCNTTNRKVLVGLPTMDGCCVLSRDIFSAPPVVGHDDSLQSSVIHFGSSYQGIEYEWNLWIETFEKLLQEMYWDSVVVHLETELSGIHTFTWESGGLHQPGDTALNIRCEWQHEVGLM